MLFPLFLLPAKKAGMLLHLEPSGYFQNFSYLYAAQVDSRVGCL